MADASQTERWRATAILTAGTVAAAVVVTLFFLAIAEPPADGVHPTGFLLAATGLPLVLIGIVFWFARRQDGIDRNYGLFED